MEGLYITNLDLPDALEEQLARAATASAEAAGIREIADAEVYRAQKLAEAATEISRNPTTIELVKIEAMKEIAKSGKSTFYQMPSWARGP
ncbi:hypothetical protein AUJ62_03625 [Candidatus Pacearchaeota archaeon CG1_02_32_21]|nr:MAG: hypothetical protein AUJ62_03625 [Candidatus Pacearchaeota archaeon CG1_02_32_21]